MNLNDEYFALALDDPFYAALIIIADAREYNAAKLVNDWYWDNENIPDAIILDIQALFSNYYGEITERVIHEILRDLENASSVYVEG